MCPLGMNRIIQIVASKNIEKVLLESSILNVTFKDFFFSVVDSVRFIVYDFQLSAYL